jgi:hypothetical protein
MPSDSHESEGFFYLTTITKKIKMMKTLKLKTMKKNIGFPDLFGSESVRPEILALHILSHVKDDTIKRMLQLPVTETGREANQGYDSIGSPTLLFYKTVSWMRKTNSY